MPVVSRRAWALIGVVAALWGASYMFIKIGLDDLAPIDVVFVRTALASLVLAPFAASRGALRRVRGATLGWLAVLALVQVVAPFLLISTGERRIDSSLAGVLVSSAPIFTALLAIRFDDAERSYGWSLVGVVVGIAGVALLFGLDLTGGGDEVLGAAGVLLAGLGYAIGPLLIKHRLRHVPPAGIVAATMGIAALVLVPVVPFTAVHGPGLDTVGAMIVLGVGGTGVAFLLFYTLVGEVGPARASLVSYIAPGFSVVYGAALLGESVGVATVAGLVLILAGSYLGAGRRPRQPAAIEPVAEGGEPTRSTA